MAAYLPLALGLTARHPGKFLDLVRPDLPSLNWGHSTTFVLKSFPRNAGLGWTDLLTQGVGV